MSDWTPEEPPDWPPSDWTPPEPDDWYPPDIPADDFDLPEAFLYENSSTRLYVDDLPLADSRPPTAAPDYGQPNWYLLDTGILIEKASETAFPVGVYEVYENLATGEVDGRYLPMATAPSRQRAGEMEVNIYRLADEAGIDRANDFGKFAQDDLIKGKNQWQALTDIQREVCIEPDILERDIPSDAFLEPHLEAAALPLYSIQNPADLPDGFDPDNTPPHFMDEDGTAYWITVDEQENQSAIGGIRSLSPGEQGYIFNTAPFLIGDYPDVEQAALNIITSARTSDDMFDMAQTYEQVWLRSHTHQFEALPNPAQEAEYVSPALDFDFER